MELPQHYNPQDAEPKWQKYWLDHTIYQFNKNSKKTIYSIDTPPPYASADHLHVGHGMHYSQFEFVARFQRMRGKEVFFPMGYDDNGLPTERYVEKKFNINKAKTSRKEFIKLCLEETKKCGQTYYDLFTRLGFSIDWELLYQTIGEKARRVAQKSFLDLYKKNRLEHTDFPTMWCTTCQTTIAQADLENVELKSHFNDIIFTCGGKELIIATTRPEMIPACVALFFHPDDERYQELKGTFAKVPLFEYEVPILTDESVEKDKGTGLMMVCTFGDKEDIEKWQKYKLHLRVIFDEQGRMNELAGEFKGMKIKPAREEILKKLAEANKLIRQQEITHAVNVHERCATEIEFLKKKQWQIKVLDEKENLIEMAQRIRWHPEHMKVRYEHWVKNLQWNWGISRQRFFGVPFPVWYCKQCSSIVLPKEDELPVDPREDKFSGKCQCGSSEVEPEMDVMDTWMTSSCTPEINADWGGEEERKKFLPMSLRPQAHDIIRTWAFYTIVKSYYHHNDVPWKNIMISGHGQDPQGQKMSKSKGNFVVAQEVIKKYSADAFRFWAASVKLGDDLPFKEKEVLTGQKFVTKLWNASKFALPLLEDYDSSKEGHLSEIFDRWLVSKLHKAIKECTDNFENYEYSKSKSELEKFFWHKFCDQYLEIAKDRLYNPSIRGVKERRSAQQALYESLQGILKLTAPIMPHITEEVYQLYFAGKEGRKSIHIADWPQFEKNKIDEKAELTGDLGVDIINTVRKYKSENHLSMKEELQEVVVISEEKDFEHMIKSIEADLRAVLKAKSIVFKGKTGVETDNFKVKVGILR